MFMRAPPNARDPAPPDGGHRAQTVDRLAGTINSKDKPSQSPAQAASLVAVHRNLPIPSDSVVRWLLAEHVGAAITLPVALALLIASARVGKYGANWIGGGAS